MLVTSCPHCGDSVTVPSRARPTSRLRCPLCVTEFTLEELMAKLPPALEFVDESEEEYLAASSAYQYGAVGGEAAGGVATLEETATSGEIGLADAEPRAEKPSYGFEGGATAESGARGLKTTPRPKKKGKNALVEIIKVALGGAAAIPIAVLILWFGFKQDPFEAGPTVAKYAPWAVPAKFHGKPANGGTKKEDSAATNNKKDGGSRIKDLPKVDNNEIPKLELGPTEPAVPVLPDPSALPTVEPPAGLDFDPLAPPPAGTDTKKTETPEAKPDPFDLSTPEAPKTTAKPEVKPAVTGSVAVRFAPVVLGDEWLQAAATVQEAFTPFQEALAGDDAELKKSQGRELYQKLALFAASETYKQVDPTSENLDAGTKVIEGIEKRPAVLQLISRAGPAWFLSVPAADRGTEGIMLVGKVASIAKQNNLHEVKVVLEDKANSPVVLVESVMAENVPYAADDRILITGAILEEPAEKIEGYPGTEKRIVFGHGQKVVAR
ncbi:MAG TPA: hypothetical protein VL096_07255 [Pirellulaceae bacterium]|nr:hypothetical protein [Pirellulaceae bacterium]